MDLKFKTIGEYTYLYDSLNDKSISWDSIDEETREKIYEKFKSPSTHIDERTNIWQFCGLDSRQETPIEEPWEEVCYQDGCNVVWTEQSENTLFWCSCLEDNCKCEKDADKGLMWCKDHLPPRFSLVDNQYNQYFCDRCINKDCPCDINVQATKTKDTNPEIKDQLKQWWENSWYIGGYIDNNKPVPKSTQLPTKCQECLSTKYFIGSYTDDICIVCGICNKTAGYLPGYGYDPITGNKIKSCQS